MNKVKGDTIAAHMSSTENTVKCSICCTVPSEGNGLIF